MLSEKTDVKKVIKEIKVRLVFQMPSKYNWDTDLDTA